MAHIANVPLPHRFSQCGRQTDYLMVNCSNCSPSCKNSLRAQSKHGYVAASMDYTFMSHTSTSYLTHQLSHLQDSGAANNDKVSHCGSDTAGNHHGVNKGKGQS